MLHRVGPVAAGEFHKHLLQSLAVKRQFDQTQARAGHVGGYRVGGVAVGEVQAGAAGAQQLNVVDAGDSGQSGCIERLAGFQ